MRFPSIAARFALIASAASLAGAAISAEGQEGTVDHLAALRACQAQADAAQRLVCYDTAVAQMVAATSQGQLKLVDATEIRRTRRGLFGFSIPDLGIFGGSSDAPDMDMLETSITSVRYTGGDAFLFKTKEGATWQVTNAPARLREVHSGDPVVFKKAAMGSYFIRIAGQIGVKGKRVE